tara:strand:+ start:382 stop:858 length:477 start_codon:yes stop_codon:yes gene_type:complete
MENYKLVIEFMDWGPIENNQWRDVDNCSTCISSVCDWNYIKTVILEIKVMVYGQSDILGVKHLIDKIDEADLDCHRGGTFDAVVEFIKYYNKAIISFEHEDKIYTINYGNELKSGDDWWHSYKVNGAMFDLHYCEDYNEIVVYLPNNNNKAIARKEIK